jgi:hypothetical protein
MPFRAALGVPSRVQYEEGSDLARAAAAARFCDVAIIVAGYTWRDEGEYLSPGGDGPWTAHFPKKPFTPEDEPAARRMAELMTQETSAGRKSLIDCAKKCFGVDR